MGQAKNEKGAVVVRSCFLVAAAWRNLIRGGSGGHDMSNLWRFLEVLSLGTWVGAAFFVGVLLAPGAFALLPTRELAGSVVGMALTRLHWLAYACGPTFLAANFAVARQQAAARRWAPLLVVVMLILTMLSQHVLTPKLAALRTQMAAEHGSIDHTPKEHPLRLQFGKLHGLSSALEMLVLVLGMAAVFLTGGSQR
jgi:uncharacterized membrane protein